MLEKLFAVFGGRAVPAKAKPPSNLVDQARLRQVRRHKADPLYGAKLGSREVTHRLVSGMKNKHGVHTESLLCALGSLAGYSCQAALRAQAVAGGLPETAFLTSVGMNDGKTYFLGEHLNKPLAESQYSIWGLAGGGARQAGCTNFPDLSELFKHTIAAMGTEAFGVPRVPEKHKPYDLPINYVRDLWPVLKPVITDFCPNPEQWPVLFGLSIQEVIITRKSVLDPDLALRLVMESAVPMSKVNLAQAN